MSRTAEKTPLELGTGDIGSLLKNYALPAIIAMTASSLYNMVDSIFIGNGVGSLAISGLGVTFPLMNLSTAFGTLVGVGAATMLSVLLGQGNLEGAGKILGNVVSMNVILGILFMVVCLLHLEPILYFFGATENTIGYAADYMRILLYGNVITHLYFGLNASMRSSGNPKFAMALTIFTVVVNTILDPIFIFDLDMGVRGAAIATVLSQFAALVVILHFFNDKSRPLHFGKWIVRLDYTVAKDSIQVGMGPFLMNAIACLMTLFINRQLLHYFGELGIGAFGIVYRISFIFLMIVMGLNQGMQPIAGYNYGARLYSRVREVYILTVKWGIAVATVGFIVSETMPELLCRAFTSDRNLLNLSVHGLKSMNLVLPIVGFQMVSTNFFQSLGMVGKSIFLSVSRQLLFLIPCVLLLPKIWQGTGIWLSFPITDFVTSAITALLIYDTLKKFKTLKDGDDPSILGSKL